MTSCAHARSVNTYQTFSCYLWNIKMTSTLPSLLWSFPRQGARRGGRGTLADTGRLSILFRTLSGEGKVFLTATERDTRTKVPGVLGRDRRATGSEEPGQPFSPRHQVPHQRKARCRTTACYLGPRACRPRALGPAGLLMGNLTSSTTWRPSDRYRTVCGPCQHSGDATPVVNQFHLKSGPASPR